VDVIVETSPCLRNALMLELKGPMVVHELTSAECREVLRLTGVARLACARGEQPYIVPVFVYYDEREHCLYGFSALGQKIDWMRANPKVRVEIERIVDRFHWATLLVFGRYEEVGDSAKDGESRRRASELFEQRPQWWLPAAGKLPSGTEHHAAVVYRIRIDRMSGRRADRPVNEVPAQTDTPGP
jgi:nitroimidazol reductase NimA-like FMN-containing flavoprotein (pyridoxamine 5'-phosphate oxidase superfamily)